MLRDQFDMDRNFSFDIVVATVLPDTKRRRQLVPLDPNAVLKQIDAALQARVEARQRSKYDDLSDLKEGLAELVTFLADTINRFAPEGSTYRAKAVLLTEEHGMLNLHLQQEVLYGILKSLRNAYAAGGPIPQKGPSEALVDRDRKSVV